MVKQVKKQHNVRVQMLMGPDNSFLRTAPTFMMVTNKSPSYNNEELHDQELISSSIRSWPQTHDNDKNN